MLNSTPGRINRPKRAIFAIAILVLIPSISYGLLFASTGFLQLSRALVWRDADVGDINRFPARVIKASIPSKFATVLDEKTTQAFGLLDMSHIGFPGLIINSKEALGSFLTSSDTTAFLVVRKGVLVHEWYGEGIKRETLQTSFSVSKSFLSTLIGIAIHDGSIGSLDDPITEYIPELLKKDPRFGAVTLKHLITMTSGLAYIDKKTPFSDAADTYYSPNLRSTALSAVITEPPGKTFLYNNYNPLLVGMALERATGQKVADYMSKVLWAPLGAESDASWSLDSTFSGFEKMESGLNARAIDFARFGTMFSHGGVVDGRQVVPEKWISEATAMDTTSDPSENYQYFWWTYQNNQFAAQGNKGQYILVAPEQDTVIVRLGRKETFFWPTLMMDLTHALEITTR
jgi:CubicO group peptidase (beta-lactamase class C family)